MTLPADAPAWLRDVVTDLVRAQVRSEERFAGVETQLSALTRLSAQYGERLDRLTAVQEQTTALLAHQSRRLDGIETQISKLTQTVTQQSDRLNRLAEMQQQQGGSLTGSRDCSSR
jgi:hypothetical protein